VRDERKELPQVVNRNRVAQIKHHYNSHRSTITVSLESEVAYVTAYVSLVEQTFESTSSDMDCAYSSFTSLR
jgi:hypothetical protein